MERPLSRSNGDEQVREGTQPDLTTQVPYVVIQLLVPLLIVAPGAHDTNNIRQRILHDLPITSGGLGVARHNVSSDAKALGPHLRSEELVREMLLVQEESQITLLGVNTHA